MIALLWSTNTVLATCGGVPSTYAVLGTGSLDFGPSLTLVNGSSSYSVNGGATFSGSSQDAINPSNGNLVAVSGTTFPALDPSSVPSFTGTTRLTDAATVTAGTYDEISAGDRVTVSFSGGTYNINAIRAGNDAIINLDSGTYFINRIDILDRVTINVATGAVVKIYVVDKFVAGNDSRINNGGAVGNFAIFLYGTGEVEFGDRTYFNGVIYSPSSSSRIRLRQDNRLSGAVVTSGSIRIEDRTRITMAASSVASMSTCASSSSPSINHIRLTHDGNALTCSPETVTVQACADASCSSTYSGSTTVTLSPTGWVSGDTITFTGGSTTAQLRKTTVGTVTLGGTATSPSAIGATQCFIGASANCSLTFADSGLIFDVPTQTACKASAPVTVSAVKKSDSSAGCAPAFSGTKSVKFWSTYSGPATGTGTVTLNSTALATASPGTAVSLAFNSSAQATFTLSYPDAGLMQLNARLDGSGSEAGLTMTGSDTFVVQPVGLAVYTAGGSCTPASATCGAFTSAGTAFNLNVKAACWASDVDTDLSDNAATPNFQLSGVALTHSLIAPSGGNSGSLGVSSFDFSAADAGIHTVNETVAEVGVFRFTATPPSYFGTSLASASSANVGRFTPQRLAIVNATLTHRADASCSPASTFTYMDEPFAVDLTLNAMNANGAITENYSTASGFAKLVGSSANWLATGSSAMGTGAVISGTDMSSRLTVDTSIASPSGSWTAGVGTLRAYFKFSRNSTLDGPYDSLALGMSPTDSDGIGLATSALDLDVDANGVAERQRIASNVRQRFGRIKLANAYGSELLQLPVGLGAEYYNGASGWVTHTLDSCTSFSLTPATNNAPTHYVRGALTLSNPTQSMSVDATTPVLGNPLASGIGALRLSAPGAGSAGGVDLSLTVPAWLTFDWDGDGANDDHPASRAVFGLFRNNLIDRRENY